MNQLPLLPLFSHPSSIHQVFFLHLFIILMCQDKETKTQHVQSSQINTCSLPVRKEKIFSEDVSCLHFHSPSSPVSVLLSHVSPLCTCSLISSTWICPSTVQGPKMVSELIFQLLLPQPDCDVTDFRKPKPWKHCFYLQDLIGSQIASGRHLIICFHFRLYDVCIMYLSHNYNLT